jgi:hypothetical protein
MVSNSLRECGTKILICVGLEFLWFKSFHCVYYKQDGVHFLVITFDVNDIIFFGNNKDVVHDLKS